MFRFNIIKILTGVILITTQLLLIQGCEFKKTEGLGNDLATKTSDDGLSSDKKNPKELKPIGEKPAWAPDIKDNMLVIIEKLASYNATPIEKLSAIKARKNPTPADAVMDVMKENSIPLPPTSVDTLGRQIPVKGGDIHARIYTPEGMGPFPVIVYYHGGGWVIANLDTYDASAKGLAEQVGAVVVSVEYRQGPENKFPTAHHDSFAAYEWVTKNAKSMNGDPSRIAVVGESAGGNLAANVSIMARDKKITAPLHQVLIYPIANNDMNSESYQKNAEAKPLNKAMMVWFTDQYLSNKNQSSNPMISLVRANLKGLPETTIITAEIDPLLSDGEMLKKKLEDSGVNVNYKKYNGVTHEFFGMATLVPEAKDAQSLVVKDLKNAFENVKK